MTPPRDSLPEQLSLVDSQKLGGGGVDERNSASEASASPVIPVFALSVMQPWAFAMLRAGKDVENRVWATGFRGPFLIHASKGTGSKDTLRDALDAIYELCPTAQHFWGRRDSSLTGGIVGMATVVGCTWNAYKNTAHASVNPSRWAMKGQWGFQIQNAQPLPFVPIERGIPGRFWRVPSEVVRALARHVREQR